MICINMECPTKADKRKKKEAAERKKAAAERKKAAAAAGEGTTPRPKKARAPRKPKAKPVPVAEVTLAPTP